MCILSVVMYKSDPLQYDKHLFNLLLWNIHFQRSQLVSLAVVAEMKKTEWPRRTDKSRTLKKKRTKKKVSVQKQRFTPDTSLLFWYLFVLESMNVFCDTCTFISFSGLALWLECLSRLIVWCLYNLKAGVLALLNASVVWLSKIIYPHCSVLVGAWGTDLSMIYI